MEALLNMLQALHPEVDFETCDTLMDDEILDSDDLEVLLAGISREYDVQIPEEEVNEENFNSAETIYDLIESLSE
ncbi:MAG: acyl carrier protein [Clostridiales bacterium]|nr:acyl carrier protein [Clostridiales bacterium]